MAVVNWNKGTYRLLTVATIAGAIWGCFYTPFDIDADLAWYGLRVRCYGAVIGAVLVFICTCIALVILYWVVSGFFVTVPLDPVRDFYRKVHALHAMYAHLPEDSDMKLQFEEAWKQEFDSAMASFQDVGEKLLPYSWYERS